MQDSKNLCNLIEKRLGFKTVLRENINVPTEIPAYGNDMSEKGGRRNPADRLDDFIAGRDRLAILGVSNRKQEPSKGTIVDEITATKDRLNVAISFIKVENPNKELIVIKSYGDEKIVIGWENFGQAGLLLKEIS